MCNLQMKSEEAKKLMVKGNMRAEYQSTNDGSRLAGHKKIRALNQGKACSGKFPFSMEQVPKSNFLDSD